MPQLSTQHMSCVSTRQMSWLSTRHMSCVSTIRYAQCSEPMQRRRRIKRRFSTFSGTSNAKPYFLRPYLEGDLSEMVSKLGVLDGAVMKKSKNKLHRSVTRVTSAVKTEGQCTIWNSSADPADPDYPDYPADQVSESAARTLPSTRAGGQDDGS